MLLKNRLFTPGPTPLLPAAQTAMASFSLHHRTADFRALFTRVLSDMKEFIGTKNDVLVLASSGTGVMEGSVSNLTSPGDKVLVLSAGKFGERWRDLAKAFGCAVELVSAPYGETFSRDEIKAKLTPDVRVVYMQGTESSTGARHDVKGVAKLVSALEDTLLVVDAITGLGTTHLDVDGWGVDVIIGGSQKALMIPPGLAYCAISERAWKRMETAKSPRYYFDFRKERKSAAKGESAYTPATSLFAALGAALEFVRQMGGGDLVEGREALVANAELAAEMTRAGARIEALCCLGTRRRADGNSGPSRGRFERNGQGIPRHFLCRRGQRPGRNEGQDDPHRPHRILRLHGHDRNPGGARAGSGQCGGKAGRIRSSGTRSPTNLRAQPLREASIRGGLGRARNDSLLPGVRASTAWGQRPSMPIGS
jgi:aspartate aminotransferase-like enzyme